MRRAIFFTGVCCLGLSIVLSMGYIAYLSFHQSIFEGLMVSLAGIGGLAVVAAMFAE